MTNLTCPESPNLSTPCKDTSSEKSQLSQDQEVGKGFDNPNAKDNNEEGEQEGEPFMASGIHTEKDNYTPPPPGSKPPIVDPNVLTNILESLATMENKLTKMDSLETMTLSLSGKLSKVQSRTDKIADQMSNFSHQLSKQDKKWETRMADISRRISKVEDDRGRLKSDWEVCKTDIDKDLSQAKKMVDLQASRISELETQLSEYIQKINYIDAIEERLKLEEQQTATLKQKLDSIGKLEEKIKQAADEKFETLKAAIKKEVRVEVIHEFRINQKAANTEVRYDILKGEALAKRHNLIVRELTETSSEDQDIQGAKDFFKDRMGLPDMRIDEAYRLGTLFEGSTYSRPLAIRFPQVKDRWKVWNKRASIKNDSKNPIWIQQDLSKQLCEDLRILHRVTRMARLQPSKYDRVKVKDFKVHINGRMYGAYNLRQLPPDLQPEVAYTPRSESSVVFFTKQSPLSNHHHSQFTLDDITYSSVEHYLAYHKALIMGNNELADSAFQSDNPADHKVILNKLKAGNTEIWHQHAERVAYTAVRPKFHQNRRPADFLVATYPLAIGEASKDKFWGTGLTLENKETLTKPIKVG